MPPFRHQTNFKEVENEVKKACEEKHITVADTDAFAAKNLHTTYK